jgi:hypothetical protein
MDLFKQDIKQWVSLDNEMKDYNKKVRELREQKNEISDSIQIYAEAEQLTKSIISIPDGGKLKFIETKQIQPLTMSYIKECLCECIDKEEDVDIILKHIKESRQYKVSKDIKRTEAK